MYTPAIAFFSAHQLHTETYVADRIVSYSYSSLSGPGYEASLKHSASNFEISCKYYQVQVYFAVNNN